MGETTRRENIRCFLAGLLLAAALFVMTGAAVADRIGKYQLAVTISAGTPATRQVVVAVIDSQTGVVNLSRRDLPKISLAK